MRSVYGKVLLWCVGTLIVSLVAFAVISFTAASRATGRGVGFFQRLNAMEIEQAEHAYESGGPQRLADYLKQLDHYFPFKHHLTDAAGKDLVTGQDRAAKLPKAWPNWRFLHAPVKGEELDVAQSPDGRYRFIVTAGPPIDPWSFAPYYFLVLASVALLSWVFAIHLASPLRDLARTVDRFGRGDLSARVHSRRRDEIGNLARAFDQMADRIETLLSAERRLLQDISHELRTPLARLSFAAELTKTAEDRIAAAARLRKEINRLTDLVGALLQMTRVEGDPSTRNVSEFPLDQFLKEVVDDCTVEADPRGCRVELDASAPLPVRGDRELLRRAIENVLRNAIRYAPEGTAVEVHLTTGDSAALISVRDYGPGVPEDLLPKIFKPFFRVDDSRASATGGVGLGLAIAHRAVTVLHGSLTASNAGPGLLVSIELPLHTHPA